MNKKYIKKKKKKHGATHTSHLEATTCQLSRSNLRSTSISDFPVGYAGISDYPAECDDLRSAEPHCKQAAVRVLALRKSLLL